MLTSSIALDMDVEDGIISVYGDGADDESILAFTDFGVDTLIELNHP